MLSRSGGWRWGGGSWRWRRGGGGGGGGGVGKAGRRCRQWRHTMGRTFSLPRVSREGRGKVRPGRNVGLRNQLRRMEVGMAACDRLMAAISSRLACDDSSSRHVTFTGTNRLNQDGLNSKNTQHTRAKMYPVRTVACILSVLLHAHAAASTRSPRPVFRAPDTPSAPAQCTSAPLTHNS